MQPLLLSAPALLCEPRRPPYHVAPHLNFHPTNAITRRLLPDRKLRSFDQQPLAALSADPPSVREQRLGYFYLEDALKQRYETFVSARPISRRLSSPSFPPRLRPRPPLRLSPLPPRPHRPLHTL